MTGHDGSNDENFMTGEWKIHIFILELKLSKAIKK